MESSTPTALGVPPAAPAVSAVAPTATTMAAAVPALQSQGVALVSTFPEPTPATITPGHNSKEGPQAPTILVAPSSGSNDAAPAKEVNHEENGLKGPVETSATAGEVVGGGIGDGAQAWNAGENGVDGGGDKDEGAGDYMVEDEEEGNASVEGATSDVPPLGEALMEGGEGEDMTEAVDNHQEGARELEVKNGGGNGEDGGAAAGGSAGGPDEEEGANIEDDDLDAASAGRLRKIVERFANRVQENDVKKPPPVPKGKGTALEDIPNVAERLSRLTRNSPIVGNLHNLIFGGKAKKSELKPQLLGFSGIPNDDALEKVKARLDGRRWPVALMKEAMDLLEIPRGASSFKEAKNPDRSMLTGRLLEWLQKPVPSGLEPPGPKKRKSVGKGKVAAATPAKKKAKTESTPAKSKATPKNTKKASPSGGVKKASPSGGVKKASPSGGVKKASPSGVVKKVSPSSSGAKKASPNAAKRASPSPATKKAPASTKKPSASVKKTTASVKKSTASSPKKAPASSKKAPASSPKKAPASASSSSKKASPASPAKKKAASGKAASGKTVTGKAASGKAASGKKSPAKPPAGKKSAASEASSKKTPSKAKAKTKVAAAASTTASKKKTTATPAKKAAAGKTAASKKTPVKSAKKSPLVTKKGKAGTGTTAAGAAAKPKPVKRKKDENFSASAGMLSKRKAGGDASGSSKASPKRAKPAKAKAPKKRKVEQVVEEVPEEDYLERVVEEDGEGMSAGPSVDDLRAKVEEIIADAEDVPNLTFKMMKSQLEDHFDMPLANRKSELIDILAEAMPSP